MRRLLILGTAKLVILQSVTFLGLLAAVVLLLVQLGTIRRLSLEGKQAHDGLCVLKDDLQRRIDDSRSFLKTHPAGIPGISATVILTSISNQEQTLASLAPITCPPK